MPYLLLTGLYLSGYVFCCLCNADAPAQHPRDAAKVVQVASQDEDSSLDQQVFHWPGSGQALAESLLQIASIPDPPVPRTQVLPIFYRHELTEHHPIRPPPAIS